MFPHAVAIDLRTRSCTTGQGLYGGALQSSLDPTVRDDDDDDDNGDDGLLTPLTAANLLTWLRMTTTRTKPQIFKRHR